MRKYDVFPSTYYNAKAVSEGALLLTIDFVRMEPVGEGPNKNEKLVAHFKETGSKLLVVTATKFDAIALIAASDETDDWTGIQIVLEAGKTLLQGKLVDCVNIRPPRKSKRATKIEPLTPKPSAQHVAEGEIDFGDEVEF